MSGLFSFEVRDIYWVQSKYLIYLLPLFNEEVNIQHLQGSSPSVKSLLFCVVDSSELVRASSNEV